MFSLGSEVLIFGTYEHPFRMMKTFTTWERRKKWRRNEIKNIIPRRWRRSITSYLVEIGKQN